MTEKEKFFLKRAPIEYAAIEVIVDLPASANVDALRPVAQEIGKGFALHSALRRQSLTIQVPSVNPPVAVDQGEFGYQFQSEDSKRLVQMRLDGVLLTQNAPYPGWEECFGTFDKVATGFWDALSPMKVRRVSSRFINRIELSHDKPLDQYLAIPLPVPQLGRQVQVGEFQSRLSYFDPEADLTGIITIALAPMPDPNRFQCYLDIDVGVMKDMSADLGEVRKALGRIREYKNLLFETSLTPKLMETFR